MKRFTPIALLLGFTPLLHAVDFGEKPNTPTIPGTPYVVHDGTRPQPRIVEKTQAVTVKAPSDAIVLFDGKNLDSWVSSDGSAPQFIIKDGVMVANGANVRTKQEFNDVQVHLEWRLPAERKVKGQHGGNSGIFLMGLYEIQILQSHNNKTYPDGQATAIYGQTPPLVNATAPQGEWQSYDIIFHAPKYKDGKLTSPAYATVIHNGIVTHSHKDFHGPTLHKRLTKYPETHPEKAPISLQWHSDPLEYRNIWVRELTDYDETAK